MTPTTHELMRAAARGDLNRMRALIAIGTNVNEPNRAGQTALMIAAGFRRPDVVSLLLNAGAKTDIQDELGLKAIDWANQDPEIIRLFETVQTDDSKPPILPTRTERVTDGPSLPGLAGAILRDHKPKAPAEVAVKTEPDASEEEEVVEAEPLPILTDDTVDQALNEPPLEATDDTLPARRGRIFAIDSPQELPPPQQSKVEIPVPAHTRSRAGGLFWLLTIVVLAALGYGTYKFLNYYSAAPTQATAPSNPVVSAPSPPAPVDQPPTTVKPAPVVKGELAGTELYVPDAEYPAGTNESGTVTVNVLASKKGIVILAKSVSGNEGLRRAAERAAMSSAFSPEKLEDALTEGTITYTFVPTQGSTGKRPIQNAVTATTGGPLANTELNLVQPDYPASARTAGISGSVTVVVRVNRAGRPMSWRPLGGDKQLQEESVKALRRSTFSPARLPGKGEVVGIITYNFR